MDEPPIIEEAGKLLRQPLSMIEEDMEIHLIELDAIRFELAEQKANMVRLLYEKRKQMLWPKDAEAKLTELDRTIRPNGDIASIERDKVFIDLIWDMVEQRLDILKLFLLRK